MGKQGYGLDGFAQTHFVGQNAVDAILPQIGHPLVTLKKFVKS